MKKYLIKYLPDVVIQLVIFLIAKWVFRLCHTVSSLSDKEMFITKCGPVWTPVLIVIILSIIVNMLIRKFWSNDFLKLEVIWVIILILLYSTYSNYWGYNCIMPVGTRAQMPKESNESYEASLQAYFNNFLEKRPIICNLFDPYEFR